MSPLSGRHYKPGQAPPLPATRESGCPVPFQSGEDFGRPEPDCPTEFEGWDQAGNAPLVELAAADFEEGGEFGLGEEFEFVARLGGSRVHARLVLVNLGSRDGDNR